MGLSSFSTNTLKDVANESGNNPRVLQLYLFEEREYSRKLIRRAKKAGFKAVFLTVDMLMLGRRNLEIRNQFKLPKHFTIANFSENVNSDASATVMDGAEAGDKKPRRPNWNRKTSEGTSSGHKQESALGYHDGKKRRLPTSPVRFHTHAANPTLC